MKINLAYNWSFMKAPQKSMTDCVTSHFLFSKTNNTTLPPTSPPPQLLLCGRHKCMLPMLWQCITRMKDWLSFFKFLKSIYSYLYYSWNYWHFLVHFFFPNDIARVVCASFFPCLSLYHLLLFSFVAFDILLFIYICWVS